MKSPKTTRIKLNTPRAFKVKAKALGLTVSDYLGQLIVTEFEARAARAKATNTTPNL